MTWHIEKMTGYTIKFPYIAIDPACPPGRHPTRNCGCKVFRTEAEARHYIEEKQCCT